jgi:dipeptidase E
MKLLLFSNSGKPYLQHCRETVISFLAGCRRVAFVPRAAFIDPRAYLDKVAEAFAGAPFSIVPLDVKRKPLKVLESADAILVGGGNTYRLLQGLYEGRFLDPIRRRVRAGMPFVGWSAGANIAGPTILTTNDWNVVGLPKFKALGLVGFNINPHYKETDPTMAQFSETRDDRIAEYHKANRNTVLGIEEQTCLHVENRVVRVVGAGRVRRFEAGKAPVDYRAGDAIPVR